MYLRITERRNQDGSRVAYYALAENSWNAAAKRAEARVVHNFGRADQVDRDGLKRLVKSINRVLDAGDAVASGVPEIPEIEIERVFELGVVLAARRLWEDLGIGAAIRRCADAAGLSAPHETALFAMAAQRLEQPGSKLACAECWLPDIAFLPEAAGLGVDQLYRALDFLAVWSDAIERDVFLQTADLFRLDVDLIFYDTTTAYFEIDAADELDEEWAGRRYPPLRRRGHSKEGRDNQPQVIVALAVTRDGMPVRSWVLPGDTADVASVARIKEDLRAWQLGRCVFVGDAGMYSAANLAALSRGLGRYILAVPMRKVTEIEAEVLTRPGRYKPVADNLQVKEVVVGKPAPEKAGGERRRRYVLCLNPQEAERQRRHREQVLIEIEAELERLEARKEDHPKAACTLLTSRRYGRYLATDYLGRPRLDPAKVKAAEKFDGKFVVITNDDTLSAEDVALGYKGGWIIESCFRRIKQTGLEVRPMFHWSPRRIEAHVKLCILALQMQRAAEIRCAAPWARIAHELAALKAVRYRTQDRAIVQRTKIPESLGEILKKLGISTPKKIMSVAEPAPNPAPA
jgi:Transposase DDE domain